MGQDDGLTALDLSLRRNEDQWPNRGAPVEAFDNNNMSWADSESVNSRVPDRADDIISLVDNETLCSSSASLSHRLYPRPLHHYPSQPNQHKHTQSRISAGFPHAYASHFENMHSLDRPKPPLQSQRQRCVPTKLDTSDTADTVDQTHGLGDHSFLLPSRPMSIATTAMTITTMDDSIEPFSSSSLNMYRSWPESEQVGFRIHSDTRPRHDNLQSNHQQQYHDLLSIIDTECLFPDDSLAPADLRPSSSRSHLLQWRRNPSAGSDSPRHPTVSSELRPPTPDSRPSTTITREEFESLPPTIQRKVSSWLSLLCGSRVPYFVFRSFSIRPSGSSTKLKLEPLVMWPIDSPLP